MDADLQPDGRHRPRARGGGVLAARLLREWPTLLVWVGIIAAALVLATGHWRRGSTLFALTAGLAAVLRLVLPRPAAGLLAVRARWLDVLILALGAGGLFVLTMVVPASPPTPQR